MLKRPLSLRLPLIIMLMLLAMPLLSACRDGDDGRVLLYDKGKYLGKEDAELDTEAVRALKSRTTLQGTGSGTSVGGISGGRGVATPGSLNLDQRTKQQGSN